MIGVRILVEQVLEMPTPLSVSVLFPVIYRLGLTLVPEDRGSLYKNSDVVRALLRRTEGAYCEQESRRD